MPYLCAPFWPRSTMDSIRVSEAPDTGSIPVEATLGLIELSGLSEFFKEPFAKGSLCLCTT